MSDARGLDSLRWLARLVLAGDASGIVHEVPVARLLSAELGCSPVVRDYALRWATHPDPRGGFASRTRWLRRLPGPWLVRLLTVLAYDGVIYLRGDEVIGHVFYQRHGDAWHGFSTAVSGGHAQRGYSVVMMMDFIALAAQTRGIRRARVGTGSNAVTRRLLERVRRREEQLGWRVSEDGWVDFRR